MVMWLVIMTLAVSASQSPNISKPNRSNVLTVTHWMCHWRASLHGTEAGEEGPSGPLLNARASARINNRDPLNVIKLFLAAPAHNHWRGDRVRSVR